VFKRGSVVFKILQLEDMTTFATMLALGMTFEFTLKFNCTDIMKKLDNDMENLLLYMR